MSTHDENNKDFTPSYLRAAEREAKRRGMRTEEYLDRTRSYRRAEDAYPGPDCLVPEEMELLVLGRAGTHASTWLSHIENCSACGALFAATKPSEEGLSALIAEVRKQEVASAQTERLLHDHVVEGTASVDALGQPRTAEGPLGWLATHLKAAMINSAQAFSSNRRWVTAGAAMMLFAIALVLGRGPVDYLTFRFDQPATNSRTMPLGTSVAFTSTDSSLPITDLGSGTLLFANSGKPLLRPQREDTPLLHADYQVTGAYKPVGFNFLRWGKLELQLVDLRQATTVCVSETIWISRNERGAWLGAFARAALEILQRDSCEQPITKEELEDTRQTQPEGTGPYAEGLSRLYQQDLQSARELLGLALVENQSNPFAHLALSEILGVLGYEREAAEEAQRAAALASSLPGLGADSGRLIRARAHETSGQWDKAIDLYRELIQDHPADARYRVKLAQAQLAGGHGPEAVATIQELRGVVSSTAYDPQLYLLEATAEQDLDRKAELAKLAAQRARVSGNSLLEAEASLVMGRALARSKDEVELALEAYENAQNIFVEQHHKAGQAQVLIDLARLYGQRLRDFRRARELLGQAGMLLEEIGNRSANADVSLLLGHTYADEGEQEIALQYYEQAEQEFADLGYQRKVAQTIISLGILKWQGGELDAAEATLKKAIEICKELGDRSNLASAYTNLGGVYEAQLELEHALGVLESALDIREEINDRGGQARTRRAIGEILVAKGDFARASDEFETALEIQKGRNQAVEEAVTRLSKSRLKLATRQTDEALRLTRQAISTLHPERSPLEAVSAYALLAQIHLERGEMGEAQEASEVAEEIRRRQSKDFTSPNPAVRAIAAASKLATARVDAQTGKSGKAHRTLRGILNSKETVSGPVSFEIRFTLGTIEAGAGLPEGWERLHKLQEEAESKGLNHLVSRIGAFQSASEQG